MERTGAAPWSDRGHTTPAPATGRPTASRASRTGKQGPLSPCNGDAGRARRCRECGQSAAETTDAPSQREKFGVAG
eukprot:scaffold60617_cov62-Phaeocystis_antarctica.AAC.3